MRGGVLTLWLEALFGNSRFSPASGPQSWLRPLATSSLTLDSGLVPTQGP